MNYIPSFVNLLLYNSIENNSNISYNKIVIQIILVCHKLHPRLLDQEPSRFVSKLLFRITFRLPTVFTKLLRLLLKYENDDVALLIIEISYCIFIKSEDTVIILIILFLKQINPKLSRIRNKWMYSLTLMKWKGSKENHFRFNIIKNDASCNIRLELIIQKRTYHS